MTSRRGLRREGALRRRPFLDAVVGGIGHQHDAGRAHPTAFGSLNSAAPEPSEPKVAMKLPEGPNSWMRSEPTSVTYRLPVVGSVAMPAGSEDGMCLLRAHAYWWADLTVGLLRR